MADDNLTLMIEANRRGLLPPDKKAALDEAVKRGLVPSEAGGVERFMMGVTDPARGIMEIAQQITGKPEAKAAETPGEGEKKKDVPIAGEVISPTDPMRIAGNIANPANLIAPTAAARIPGLAASPMARTVLSGTISSLLQPVGEPDDFMREKGKQAGTGMILGYGLSVAGKGASKGVEALGRWLVSRYPENIMSHAVGLVLKRIEQDRSAGGLTAKNMLDLIRTASSEGRPMVLADVGGRNVERLAGNVYRRGGEGAARADQLFESRDAEAANRLRQNIAQHIHGGMTVFEATELLLASRSASARPLYEHTDTLQGIWSPRLGEFFKDPVVQKGMARGYELERLSSLAENRPFNPTAMGVDISDPNNIQFLRAPNMRVLDMAKQGLDDMISAERNDITGRLSAQGVALDKLRRAYLKEIDTLDKTGVYKKARAAWGGHSASLDALKAGRAVFGDSPEANAALVSKLDPGDIEFYRMGVADRLNEKILKTGFSSDEAKDLIRNPWMREQLRPAFKSSADFDSFVESVAQESRMFARRRGITGGSQTAERIAEDQSPLIAHAEAGAEIAGNLAKGKTGAAIMNFYRMYKDLGLLPDNKLNEATSMLLFSPLVPYAKTEEARALRSLLSPPPPGRGNYLAGPARAIQDTVMPIIGAESGELSGGRPLPLPHYQEGGVSPGGKAVVGEDGPEVVNLPPGAEVIPNMDTLLRMMGSGPVPAEGEPLTRALPGYEERSPGELAMIRTQEATRPTRGRADIPPEHIAQALVTGGSLYAAPESLTARAIAAAPKTMTALLAALGMTSATKAGENEFQWSDPNKQRVDRLNKIDQEIKTETERKTKSAPGTQKARIDGLNSEKATLLEQQTGDYNAARVTWQQKQDDARAAAEEKKRRETSFFDVVPGTRAAISAAVPFISYLGGKYIGKRLPAAPAMGAAGLGGGLEGLLSQYLPTEIDMGLPREAPARQNAAADLTDPNYWKRLGAVSGGNAALGAYGAFRGALGRRVPLPKIQPKGSGPSTPPAAPVPMAPSGPTLGAVGSTPATTPPQPTLPTAGSSKPPTTVRNGVTYELTSSGWRVQAGQKGGGRFMKKPPAWPSWLPKGDE